MKFSTSRQLIKNTNDFLNIRQYSLFYKIFNHCGIFYGWGRKRSGQKAVELAQKFGTSYVLLEDGFIRSLGLGVDGSPSFSIVEDDVGIYYDATASSKLENILNIHDFSADDALMETACKAMALIREYRISKYNNAPDVPEGYFGNCVILGRAPGIHREEGLDSRLRGNDEIHGNDERVSGMTKRVLIVAQTAADASLKYGLAEQFTTEEMIDAAITENPGVEIWLKIHPDVLSGKKRSDIDIELARQKCKIIEENFNPISFMEHVDIVYTKTSQMGFEALIMGKQCVCFGMPFYAGWGITDDRVACERRKRKLSVEEVFAAAYILYTRYYNPYQKKPSDIIDTIDEIIKQRKDNYTY
jgi:capsule polysaccharide export protein KpsC/LpsZ